MELLEENKWLQKDVDGNYIAADADLVNVSDITSMRADIEEAYPHLAGHLNLVYTCAQHYWDILTGKTLATDIIFPGGSNDLVEPMYKNNPLADIFNKQVGHVVLEYIDKFPGKKLQILEIGAGTGGTSASHSHASKG